MPAYHAARPRGHTAWSDGPSQAAARGRAARAPDRRRGCCCCKGLARCLLWALACLEEVLGAIAASRHLLLGMGIAAVGAVCLYGAFIVYGVLQPLDQFYGEYGAVVVLLSTLASCGYLAGTAFGFAVQRWRPANRGVDLANGPATEDPAA